MRTLQRTFAADGQGRGDRVIFPSDAAATIGGAAIAICLIRGPCHRGQQAERHHKRQQQRQQSMGLVASHVVFLLVYILYLQTPQRGNGMRAGHAAGIEPMGMR